MENTDHRLLLLPGDVLIQILVWLPVKSLLRFKSVCKSWCALIQSSFFIHLHATLPSSSSSKFPTLIFETSPYDSFDYNTTKSDEETKIFMLTSSRSGDGEEVFEVKDLGFPPFYKVVMCTHQIAMVGSCNGLICLHDSKLRRDVSLWNPATRQFRLLPKSLTFKEEEELKISSPHVQDLFGFGFDVKNKDYKVVQITSFRKVEYYVLRVQVYSLSTDSWRILEDGEEGGINSLFPKSFNSFFMNTTNGVYLNGCYFFKGVYLDEDRIRRQWILSFDFTNEIFTPMQFPPDDELHLLNSTLILTCFGDKIAFFTRVVVVEEEESSSRRRSECDQSNFVYDIWVLNEHWTKLQHSIRVRKRKEEDRIFPRCISNNGEFALIETRDGAKDWKLMLFNLVTKEEKTVFPTGMGLERADVYKPSLVSIIGGGNGNGTAAAAADKVV